jgi:lantibiotic modifying enzyme
MGRTPLTGLSHGHAGIGTAILELFAVTGRPEFLEAARGAFAYEDSVFSEEAGNWPDLRVFENTAGQAAPAGPRFPVAWCHGAPGIALSRLRAAILDPARRGPYLASARTALATTAAALESSSSQDRSDASLCHGLSGLAEVLLIAGRLLGEPEYCVLAEHAGRAMIAAHGEAGDWPSGVPSGGPSPTLMLGSAGVGYFFLRLHDPEATPPLLLIF